MTKMLRKFLYCMVKDRESSHRLEAHEAICQSLGCDSSAPRWVGKISNLHEDTQSTFYLDSMCPGQEERLQLHYFYCLGNKQSQAC